MAQTDAPASLGSNIPLEQRQHPLEKVLGIARSSVFKKPNIVKKFQGSKKLDITSLGSRTRSMENMPMIGGSGTHLLNRQMRNRGLNTGFGTGKSAIFKNAAKSAQNGVARQAGKSRQSLFGQ